MPSPEQVSYLAGMLDSYATVYIATKPSPKVRITVKSASREQILLFQSLYGGEILRHNDSVYLIRCLATVFARLVAEVLPYMLVRRDMFAKAAAVKRLPLPSSSEPLIEHYVAGCVDAYCRFAAETYGSRIYPTFTYTYHSDLERVFWGIDSARNNSIRWTWNRAKAALEKIAPFTLEYPKYHSALHLWTPTPPLDESILSTKDRAYYEAEAERMRQQRASDAKVKELTDAWPILDAQWAAEEKEQARLARETLQKSTALKRDHDDALIIGFNADWSAFEFLERHHDIWWSCVARDSKVCKVCSQPKPLDQFNRSPAHVSDPLKNQCKTCEYERYVKPRLAELNERCKAWQRANPEKWKEANRKQKIKPQNRIRASLGKQIKHYLGSKRDRYCDLIGCTPAHLTAHLESLFTPGLTWDNYGKIWYVDHVIPVRAFDLTVKEQRLACYNWRNLAPLAGGDNVRKSDRLPDGRRARDVYPRQKAPVVAMPADSEQVAA